MEQRRKFIISDPSVMMGKPVIAGTRITVELIVEKLAAGETIDQILDAHPRLTKKQFKRHLVLLPKPCVQMSSIPFQIRFLHELYGRNQSGSNSYT